MLKRSDRRSKKPGARTRSSDAFQPDDKIIHTKIADGARALYLRSVLRFGGKDGSGTLHIQIDQQLEIVRRPACHIDFYQRKVFRPRLHPRMDEGFM